MKGVPYVVFICLFALFLVAFYLAAPHAGGKEKTGANAWADEGPVGPEAIVPDEDGLINGIQPVSIREMAYVLLGRAADNPGERFYDDTPVLIPAGLRASAADLASDYPAVSPLNVECDGLGGALECGETVASFVDVYVEASSMCAGEETAGCTLYLRPYGA